MVKVAGHSTIVNHMTKSSSGVSKFMAADAMTCLKTSLIHSDETYVCVRVSTDLTCATALTYESRETVQLRIESLLSRGSLVGLEYLFLRQ